MEINSKGITKINNLFSEEICDKITNFIGLKKDIDFEPFSNSPYRTSITIDELNSIDNKFMSKINEIIDSKLNGEFFLNNITCHFKDKWLGSEEHWHQDYFYNSNTHNGSPEDFLRIFIALDQHSKENGCMIFMDNSHKEGLLDFNSILSIHSYQKNRTTSNILDKCYEKYGLSYYPLNKGCAILFNSLILHSSPSNQTNNPRRALQLQLIRKGILEKSKEEIKEFKLKRKNFEIKNLEDRINGKNNLKGEFSFIFEKKNGKLLYKANDETFEEIYKSKDDPWNQSDLTDKYYEFTRNKIFELLSYHKEEGLKILELGCGNGFSTNYLKSKLQDKNWEFYGCDISPTAVKKAKEKYKDINFFVHNIKNKLKVENNFDIVIFGDMLWYILDDLKECISNSLEVTNKEVIFYNAFLKEQKYGKEIINGYKGFKNFCDANFNVSYSFESDDLNYKSFGVVCLKNI